MPLRAIQIKRAMHEPKRKPSGIERLLEPLRSPKEKREKRRKRGQEPVATVEKRDTTPEPVRDSDKNGFKLTLINGIIKE